MKKYILKQETKKTNEIIRKPTASAKSVSCFMLFAVHVAYNYIDFTAGELFCEDFHVVFFPNEKMGKLVK